MWLVINYIVVFFLGKMKLQFNIEDSLKLTQILLSFAYVHTNSSNLNNNTYLLLFLVDDEKYVYRVNE